MVVSCTITTSSCTCHLPLLSLILLLLLLSLTWDALWGLFFGSSEERAQPPPPLLALSFLLHSLCLLPLLRPLLSLSDSFISTSCSSFLSSSSSSFLSSTSSSSSSFLYSSTSSSSSSSSTSSSSSSFSFLYSSSSSTNRGLIAGMRVLNRRVGAGFWGCTKMLIVHLANRHRTHFSTSLSHRCENSLTTTTTNPQRL